MTADPPSRSRSTRRLAPAAWDALIDGLARFFHFKDDFERYIRSELQDYPELLAPLEFHSPKITVANRLVGLMQRHESKYQPLAVDMLVRLSQEDRAFPRLARLPDGADKVAEAQGILDRIVQLTAQYTDEVKARERIRAEYEADAARAEARKSLESELERLRKTFLGMQAPDVDPHQRGRDFELLLNELFQLFDLDPRAAYDLPSQQIDGAFTFDTDDYLLEAKWHRQPIEPKDVAWFADKVAAKAKNTMGLFVSVNGFTEGAITMNSKGTAIVLADGADLYAVLEGRISLVELLRRKKRHAAETGHPFIRIHEML